MTAEDAFARELPWSHHLVILEQSKRPEEREFYLRLAIRERWSKRDLERQFKAALFERAVLSPPSLTAAQPERYPPSQFRR
jgi:predicted nuclease of restriction endonuclease-like (RecB) superfamily